MEIILILIETLEGNTHNSNTHTQLALTNSIARIHKMCEKYFSNSVEFNAALESDPRRKSGA